MKQFPADKLKVRNTIPHLIFKIMGGLLMFWVGSDLWDTALCWFSFLFFGVGGMYLFGSLVEWWKQRAVLTLSSKGLGVGEKRFFRWEDISTQIITESEDRNIRYLLKVYSTDAANPSTEVEINGIELSHKDLEDALQFYRNQKSEN